MKLLITALILASPFAKAADCKSHLTAVNIWEDEENDGQIVLKNTQFPLHNWDPNDTFDAVLLNADAAKSVKAPILEVQYQSKNKAKKKLETFKDAKPFEQNADLKIFSDFQPRDFFSVRQNGSYTVKLKDGDVVLCTETHTYSLGH